MRYILDSFFSFYILKQIHHFVSVILGPLIFILYICNFCVSHRTTILLQDKSGVPLVAHEKFAEPKEVEVYSLFLPPFPFPHPITVFFIVCCILPETCDNSK